jgi:hypothetical protein
MAPDRWTHPFLDSRPDPSLQSAEDKALRTLLRRMRTRARQADRLAKLNSEMHKQIKRLKENRGISGSGFEHHPTDVTRAQVATLTGMGMPRRDICKFMGFGLDTLSNHYADELDVGRIQANLAVAMTLHEVATDKRHSGVVPAAKKWLESRGDGQWDAKQTVAHTKVAANERPVIDVRALDPDEREQFKALLMKMEAAALVTDQSVVAEQAALPP